MKLDKKLEERLEPRDLRSSKTSSTSTAMVVDFMSIIRRQPLQNMRIYIIRSAWLSVQNSCEFNHLDIVFDSYIEDSIKEGDRISRVDCEPFEVINMSLTSKIPVQIDRFWASPANKIALQKLCSIFLKDAVKSKHLKIVLSSTLNCDGSISPCFEYREDVTTQIREDLSLFFEEADTRITPHTHIYHNILNGYKRIVVISNDTDVFALILHYMSLFFVKGINELWLKFGTGSYTRMLPMHIMHSNVGHEMCSVILRLHVLTGCDVTSKIGTKHGTLNTKPIDYLKTFGQSKNLCHEEAEKAESYLVKVLRSSSACTTMNELRIESYLDKSSSLTELRPRSSSIFGHILRSHFVIHQYLNLLNATEMSNVQ